MKYRNLDRGDVLPASWTDAIQEYVSTLAANLTLTVASSTAIRVLGGADSAQAAIGIGGLWRYRTSNIDATITGGAGVKDVFVTATANSFSSSPQPDTDNTDYAFGVQVLATGGSPAGVAAYRKIGEADWDGVQITGLRQLVGLERATAPLTPTSPLPTITPLTVLGAAGQTAPLLKVGNFTINAAGQIDITGSVITAFPAEGITIGGDTNLYRAAASVLRTDDSFRAALGFMVEASTANHAFRATQAAANFVLSNFLLAGDANPTVRIDGSGKLEWGAGGATAVDTNLYRRAANELATDDMFAVITAATGNTAICVHTSGDTQRRFAVAGSGLLSWGTGTATADVNLYRAAADLLQTDDQFRVVRAASTDVAIASMATGDASNRFTVTAAGVLSWGPGTAGADVVLYRSAASTLKTDTAFNAGLHLRARTGLAGEVLVGDNDTVARIAFGADVNLYRSAADVLKTDDTFDALGFRVAGSALAASHLSNGITGTGAIVLAAAPALSGAATAATPTVGDNSTRIATTAFVTAAVAGVSGGAGGIAYLGNTQTFTAANTFSGAVTLSAGFTARAAVGSSAEIIQVTGDSGYRYSVLGGGDLYWGNGAGTVRASIRPVTSGLTFHGADGVQVMSLTSSAVSFFGVTPATQRLAPVQAAVGSVPAALAAASTLNDVIGVVSRLINSLQDYGIFGQGAWN